VSPVAVAVPPAVPVVVPSPVKSLRVYFFLIPDEVYGRVLFKSKTFPGGCCCFILDASS